MGIHAKRRDLNHAEIRDALRAVGWSVYDSGSVGKDFPDLVVGAAGLTFLVEIKSAAGRLSEGQQEFARLWRGGRVIIAYSAEQAICLITEGIAQWQTHERNGAI